MNDNIQSSSLPKLHGQISYQTMKKSCRKINEYLSAISRQNQQLDELKQIQNINSAKLSETKQMISERRSGQYHDWVNQNLQFIKQDHKLMANNMYYDFRKANQLQQLPIKEVMNNLARRSHHKLISSHERIKKIDQKIEQSPQLQISSFRQLNRSCYHAQKDISSLKKDLTEQIKLNRRAISVSQRQNDIVFQLKLLIQKC